MKLSTYVTGAVIVWVGILIATALLLAGTPYFPQMIPILGAGVAWFVVIVPGAMEARRRTAGSSLS